MSFRGHIAGQTDTMPLRVEQVVSGIQQPRLLRGGVGVDVSGTGHAGGQGLVRRTRLRWKRASCRGKAKLPPSRLLSAENGSAGALPSGNANRARTTFHPRSPLSISVKNITKRFGEFRGAGRREPRRPRRIAAGLAGPFGFGQDDLAADHRRAGRGRPGRRAASRRGRHEPLAPRSQRRLRLSALCPVSSHDGVREHRLRAARPQGT